MDCSFFFFLLTAGLAVPLIKSGDGGRWGVIYFKWGGARGCSDVTYGTRKRNQTPRFMGGFVTFRFSVFLTLMSPTLTAG